MKNLIKSIKGFLSGKLPPPPLKKLIFSLITTVAACLQLFCGNPVTELYSPYANFTYIKISGNVYSQGIDPKVGYETSTLKTYRKALQFNLTNIPSNATINGCEIIYMAGVECGIQDGTIIFTKMPYDWPTYFNNKKVYDSIGLGVNMGNQSITDLRHTLGHCLHSYQ